MCSKFEDNQAYRKKLQAKEFYQKFLTLLYSYQVYIYSRDIYVLIFIIH